MTGSQEERDLTESLKVSARDLLRGAGVECRDEPAITRLAGGANNGVFRIDLGGESYILKQYFSHAEDPRDRFGTETALIDFLWRNGVRMIPELLATSEPERLALYRFIRGRTLRAPEIDASHVDQAAAFCRDLFRLQSLSEAQELPTASEACFSIADHLECVGRRVANLRSIGEESPVHSVAVRFVNDDLLPCWQAVREHVQERFASQDDSSLPAEGRILSPSDFGFHNAILTDSGRLCFFDFEYAGWDDPAKLVCDFFCQVEIPAPRSLMPRFIESLAPGVSDTEWLAARVECLFPVYLLKWCAIVLNEFVPVASTRRRFSAAEVPSAEQLELQLEKARGLLRSVDVSSM